MLLVAALLSATPPPPAVAPVRQARAMVTIISSAKLRFAEMEKADPKQFRDTVVRSTDGATESARIIEFE